jgi:hypothetical protein
MPDGTTAQFPDGTKPEVIERVKREKAAAMQRRQPEQRAPGLLQTAIRAFGQGVTYGGSDEATAAVESAMGRMPYSQSLSEQRQEQEAMRRANPLTYGASELAGALLSPNPFGKYGAVTSTGGKLLREAGVSGAIGAVQGALEANPEERVAGAVRGGATAAVVGPAFASAMDFARGGKQLLGRAFNPNEPRIASQQVLDAMREAGLTGPELRQQILTGRADDTVPFGMRLGMPGQLAAERAAIGGGSAADISREASQNILSESGSRMMNVVSEMTGGNRKFTQDILDTFKKARDKNASDLYGKARAVGIVQDDDIVNMIVKDPLTRSLYKQAQVNAQRKENLRLPDLVDKDGNLIQNAYPSVAALDYLLRALRAKKDQAFKQGNVNADGIKALFDSLDSRVKELVPEYAAARAKFADDSELIKLSQLGQQFINMSESARKVALRGLDPDKLEVVRGTARDALFNRLASADDIGLAKMLTSSKQNRDLLEFLAVSPEQAAQAALRIRQERQLQEFSRAINPNIGSRTARTMAAAGEGVDQLANAERATQFLGGNAASRFMTLLNIAGGRLRGLTPGVREDMARMLTELDPQQQMQILGRLDLEDQRLMKESIARANKRMRSVQTGARIPGLLTAEEQQ